MNAGATSSRSIRASTLRNCRMGSTPEMSLPDGPRWRSLNCRNVIVTGNGSSGRDGNAASQPAAFIANVVTSSAQAIRTRKGPCYCLNRLALITRDYSHHLAPSPYAIRPLPVAGGCLESPSGWAECARAPYPLLRTGDAGKTEDRRRPQRVDRVWRRSGGRSVWAEDAAVTHF